MSRKAGIKDSKYVKYDEVNMAGWDVLAAAIVRTAYADFVSADRKMRETLAEQESLTARAFSERMNWCAKTKYEVRRFFKSKWYSDLCNIDRERFLKKLDEVEAAV